MFTFILSRKEFAYEHVVLKNARMVDAEWIHLKITTTLFAWEPVVTKDGV
jgi:hypothetical protein